MTPEVRNTTPAIILPPNTARSTNGQRKRLPDNERAKQALECLETASRNLKQKVVIDFNPRHGFWTVKIGFLWGRDESFVKASAQCLEKVLPLMNEKDK